MKQLDPSNYEVKNGEVVTVKIIAFHIGDTAVFTMETGVAVTQVSASPRTYQFTPHFPAGKKTLFGSVLCDFTGSQDDPEPFFAVKVSAEGSGPFDGPVIKKSDAGSGDLFDLDFHLPKT